MSRIIFIYAGDPHNMSTVAPYTITRRLYDAFTSLAEVVYYDWCHCGPFQPVDRNDVIVGHPNYPDNTATRQLFQSACRARLLIFPFHHGMPEINFPFDDLVRQADAVLSITGPYWYDTIEQTRFASWKPKITRLDMAIDMANFPVIKTSFSNRGSRSFFYVGADRPEKGLSVLKAIFEGTLHILHLYGMIDGSNQLARLPNVHLHGWADMCDGFRRDLAATADCLVHGGISDANPTTLLEAASMGFAVACTPQSGYWPDQPFYSLNAADIDGSRAFLDYMQWVPEETLRLRVEQVRATIAANHNWDVFISKAVETVKRFL